MQFFQLVKIPDRKFYDMMQSLFKCRQNRLYNRQDCVKWLFSAKMAEIREVSLSPNYLRLCRISSLLILG